MKTKLMKMGLVLTMVAALGATSVTAFADSVATPFTGAANKVMNKFGGNSLMDKLIKDGVVTQAQLDKYRDQMHQERTDVMKTALNQLVKDGKLTQVKADAFLSAVDQNHTEKEALRAKLDAMTEADRIKYLQNNDLRGNDPVQALITKGVLTTADLNVIHSVIGGKGCQGNMGNGGMGKGGMGKGHRGGMGNPFPANGTPGTGL